MQAYGGCTARNGPPLAGFHGQSAALSAIGDNICTAFERRIPYA